MAAEDINQKSQTKIINDLQIFIEDMFDKFTAEGN